ncbi:ferritin-like domain-containing protein [Nocardia yunnanensis]|uniref:Ferritin-like domain-containing protein n=1 Tax=Nocardia yunnanensis TaxID=2382165 RepID=A0A386Z6U2_9NOCA|nr:ferritin-like domain-containing protein [Nocardia yunnanensis]AYF72804.1 ferritin-like domain-containing protein [Nocardia yunnanensis]
MSTRDTTTLLTQLRAVRDLTNTEVQIAQTRIAQARTEAVRRELTENAEHGRARVQAIESVIRDLGGVPAVVGPLFGRLLALFKALGEQSRPFEEALLGDLSLEHQLLDRSRYIKALATDAQRKDVVALAERLIEAHTATVQWLTTVLAEDALGGPAALRRTPAQIVTGTAVKLANIPASWSAHGIDRVLDTFRSVPPALEELRARGEHAGEVAAKTLSASRDAALQTAEQVTRREGARQTADALRSVRTATGVLEPGELPIEDYDELNVSQTVSAVKELESPSDLRAILAYEEANKNRHGVVSATQTRLAAIAPEITGLN